MPDAMVTFPDGTRIEAEVADTDAARARGLMGREALADGCGMLFVFDPPGPCGFWMKSVRFPLDILWLDAAGRIVDLVMSAPPCPREPCPVYASRTPAAYVLEVTGGVAAAHGLRPGDQLTITCPPTR